MTRYVVIGAGAVGSVLAAQLHAAGREVVLVARGRQVEVLRSRGLTVLRPASAGARSTEVVRVPVAAGPDDVDLRHDDVLLLTTKAQDVDAALDAWAWQPVISDDGAGLVGADLPLVTFQNGVSTERAALRRFRTVLGATIWIAASHTEPGVVVSPSWPRVGLVWVGRSPRESGYMSDPVAHAVAADLDAAGFAAWSVPDVARWKAHKLVINATNGLDLFSREAPADRELLDRLAADLVRETEAVLDAADLPRADPRAVGVGPGSLVIEEVPGHVGGRRSTWQSFARGAGSEVDHLNGDVVQLGRLHGVPTPANELLQRVLGAAFSGETRTLPLPAELLRSALPASPPASTPPSLPTPTTLTEVPA
ncbi:ketopantoate reductase [Quadrisphaera granulorum]|uniref:Ketopantoate reductase n=1 Tax=Quadrisphaera granulorum TaxID=317664 RepID=A0A315ZT16_9ACTN|nr:2-dehydropantoate 2-reductase N-terminal domain-containing protein [Quadrisphaera granulorum]PWJ48303.1 ketopantoate reductase [Quadrisphaera granulorum]SZE98464.1 ketopantoate reductase [Quadrisphaera granulorum]